MPRLERRSSWFIIQWRLAALIRQLGAGFGYLDAQIVHGFVDSAARGQITTAAPGRQTTQASQEQADQILHLAERFLLRDQLPFFSASHLVALRATKISTSDPPSTWWPGERD